VLVTSERKKKLQEYLELLRELSQATKFDGPHPDSASGGPDHLSTPAPRVARIPIGTSEF
jgi:hypothetical protein